MKEKHSRYFVCDVREIKLALNQSTSPLKLQIRNSSHAPTPGSNTINIFTRSFLFHATSCRFRFGDGVRGARKVRCGERTKKWIIHIWAELSMVGMRASVRAISEDAWDAERVLVGFISPTSLPILFCLALGKRGLLTDEIIIIATQLSGNY